MVSEAVFKALSLSSTVNIILTMVSFSTSGAVNVVVAEVGLSIMNPVGAVHK